MNSLFLTILVTCQPVYVLHYRNLTTKFGEYKPLDVCLSVHRCICVGKKNQLDATGWFIALIICSTRFGHFYDHSSGARDYMCYYRLWCAVLGCWLSGVRCRAADCASRKRHVARHCRTTCLLMMGIKVAETF